MPEVRIGIALHQVPRDPKIRTLIVPPEGYMLVEWDFSGQEVRWMACYSQDWNMLNVFNSAPPYDDLHGFMGARLGNQNFEDLIAHLRHEAAQETFKVAKNNRYLGKFANLSLQYRCSANTLKRKARIDYGIPMVDMEAQRVKYVYENTYTGIPQYWKDQISIAKAQGFVETFAGSRYRFPADAWTSHNNWASSSTAINFPIQGVGANQKELAMKYLKPWWEKVYGFYAFDLHDGIYSFLPEKHALEMALEAREMLNNLPYEKEWGYHPIVPFPVDCKIGYNWGDLKEVA